MDRCTGCSLFHAAWVRGSKRPEEIPKPLPAVLPRLPHNVLAVKAEQIEGHETHVSPGPVPLLEECLYPFVTIHRAGFPVEHGRSKTAIRARYAVGSSSPDETTIAHLRPLG